MNFSDEWRSLWPVASVFAAPNLLSSSSSSSSSLGPLLFSPPLLPYPPPLLSLPPRSFPDPLPLLLPPPLPPCLLPVPRQWRLPPLSRPRLPRRRPPPSPCPYAHASNNLVVLPWRSHRRGLIVFFPAGENADLIGFLGLSFEGPTPEVRVDEDGDVFKQREGFKHPHHRILKMSVVSASSSNSWFPIADSASPGNPLVEGFLVATTLYSVNWFRVETRVLDSGRETPFLVPLAKQGFDSSVVDACWSPHFEEESAALLESGDLCWFNLDSKCGGKIRVSLGGGVDPGEWLSCNFGGQPWIVIVACSKAVALVDLRRTEGYEHKVLARIEMPGLFDVAPSVEKKGSFLSFCKANFNDFHFSVVTEHQLLLFDTRQPLVPVLTWDHGLENPSYIAMFRLSELRPSDEFKWASDSGFAILVGSFWNGEFNLFCYGPKEKGTLTDTTLYAWELPSSFPLTDQVCGDGSSLINELFFRENFSTEKLELQRYNAVYNISIERSYNEGGDPPELQDSLICPTSQEGDASIPTSIFEMASRRILSCLRPDLLPLAFSKYSELFGGSAEYSFEFLEVPSCLQRGEVRPFLVVQPSRRGEKSSSKASPGEGLVGPVIPIPFLLTLQERNIEEKSSFVPREEPGDDLLDLQCKKILKHVYPEISIADIGNCNGWSASEEQQNDKTFFVYEPSNKLICNKTGSMMTEVLDDEKLLKDNTMQASLVPHRDENFATFICGIVDRACSADHGHDLFGSKVSDLSPVKLDFDTPSVTFKPGDQKIYKCLKRQFSKWQESYKPYQDFCTSSKIPKIAQ
uniref:Uncharacterized protein n=1 Tax=Ananas comosus var. bracteatus TaxID=296719 RepID=A0A6V7PTR0_ANACO|nr:unnamed protein product [Ananas comosus var. bracteatus]